MSELVTQSGAQEQQEPKRDTHLRGAYRRLYHRCDSRGSAPRPRRQGCAAQDKDSLKSPSRTAFSEFIAYEKWAVVSSTRTDEVLKVIVANPAMIEACKAGTPGSGQPLNPYQKR